MLVESLWPKRCSMTLKLELMLRYEPRTRFHFSHQNQPIFLTQLNFHIGSAFSVELFDHAMDAIWRGKLQSSHRGQLKKQKTNVFSCRRSQQFLTGALMRMNENEDLVMMQKHVTSSKTDKSVKSAFQSIFGVFQVRLSASLPRLTGLANSKHHIIYLRRICIKLFQICAKKIGVLCNNKDKRKRKKYILQYNF